MPIGGCLGFGVQLPASGFDPAQGKTARPASQCFPKTAAWLYGTGFTVVPQSVAGKQCTYAASPSAGFCN